MQERRVSVNATTCRDARRRCACMLWWIRHASDEQITHLAARHILKRE
jgi:hypothetical protein